MDQNTATRIAIALEAIARGLSNINSVLDDIRHKMK